jgi:hypothetical protein
MVPDTDTDTDGTPYRFDDKAVNGYPITNRLDAKVEIGYRYIGIGKIARVKPFLNMAFGFAYPYGVLNIKFMDSIRPTVFKRFVSWIRFNPWC